MKPLLADSFRLASCRAQVVCEPDGGVIDRAAVELPARLGGRFDGTPSRSDAGGVTLRSTDRTWQLEVAESRSALTWNRPAADAPAPSVAEFFARAGEVLAEVTTWRRTRAFQLLAVIERIGVHATPGLALAQRLFSVPLASLLESPRSIILETEERRKLGDFDVHTSLRFRSGVKLAASGDKAVLTQHQIATPAEHTLADFKPARIAAFLAMVAAHTVQAFDQLYPP